jgi:imidazoleglycerol phosphate synthase glutamine amidotransferase subunit HisH
MIAVVQYNAGNIRSVQNALQRLGCQSIVTDVPEEIERASHVIFPGRRRGRFGHELSERQRFGQLYCAA